MKIIYVIPSYNRAELLCQTTLPLLDKAGIESVHLYIEKDQYKRYTHEISKYIFNIRIIFCCVNQIKGIGKLRNYIRSSYGDGANLLMIDDDIKDICIAKDNTLESLDNIQGFVKKMFTLAVEKDVYYWGVQLHNNPFFMKKEIIEGLTYVNGSFTGHRINRSKKKIEVNMNHFEDYLFSIKHFIRDKSILKAGNVCLKTKCFNINGGICDQVGGLLDRKREAKINGEVLETYFKDLLDIKYSKKYKIDNIKLKNIKWRECYVNSLEIYEYATDWIESTTMDLSSDEDFDDIEKALEGWNKE